VLMNTLGLCGINVAMNCGVADFVNPLGDVSAAGWQSVWTEDDTGWGIVWY